MNALFVITNINGTYGDAYSFGLASLASVTRDKKIDFDYAIINALKDYNGFFESVERLKPKIIAYTSVSSQFRFVKEISMRIKEVYRDKIIQVCGGVHPTIFPECILDSGGLDGIFIGEGEHAFSDFLDRIANGLSYKDVHNFAYNDNGNLVKNRLYPLISSLDEIPFPEREKYGYERFIKQDGYAVFMFSRGCPYFCSYCSNHAIAKVYNIPANRPRYRSPVSCIEEIMQLKKRYSFGGVFVGDDTFGLNKGWMKEFCTQYAKELKLPLICQLRVNLVNDELMEYLKLAGCAHVSCGVESGNDFIRNEIMKRNISEEQIVNAYSLFKKYGMTSNAINMIGLPHETGENIWDTVQLNRKINPTSSGVNIFYPYRGTDLGDYCFEHGLVDRDAYGNFSRERRDSVLKFPLEFKEKLLYFHQNWGFLVYRYRLGKLIKMYLAKAVKNRFPYLWSKLKLLQRIKLFLRYDIF